MSVVDPKDVECDKGVSDVTVRKWTITFVGDWRKSMRNERDEVVIKLSIVEISE